MAGTGAAAVSRTSLRTSLVCGALAAVAQALLVLPFLGRYGWDRDELYFLSAGRRPTWGYVDFPPLTAWLAWAVHAFFGDSLAALRLTSLLAMSVTVVLVALMARELGGGRGTQLAAALVWGVSPYALGAASIFHPTWLDALCWVALLYVVLLALSRDRPELWLAAGVIAGVGLEAKYTIVVLLAALLVALLATERHLLRTRWPWLALAIAVGLWLPNLVWQQRHGWPSIEFASSQNAKTADDTPPAAYVGGQLLLGAAIVLAVVGVVALWRVRRLRALALVPPLVTLAFLLERGRAYYPLPADAVAVAAGTVALAGWLRSGTAASPARAGAAGGAPARRCRARPADRRACPQHRLDGVVGRLGGHVLQGRDRLARARPPDRRRLAPTSGARASHGSDRRGELRGGVRARAVRTRAGAPVSALGPPQLAVLASAHASAALRPVRRICARLALASVRLLAATGDRRQSLAHRQRGARSDHRGLPPARPLGELWQREIARNDL